MPYMEEREETPDGVFSILDTDLYKLTMQCAILKYFPNNVVEYAFTNRTPHMRFNTEALIWLNIQVGKLVNVYATPQEIDFLKSACPYFPEAYLNYLLNFRFAPGEHINFVLDNEDPSGFGDLHISIKGRWVDTILYEIPVLALASEIFFKYCHKDWNHDGQREKACAKGVTLLKEGCLFSEYGTRRRRDYRTHDLVMKGLTDAAKEGGRAGWPGKLTGTSNVHFAMKYGLSPVGTVAHEWYMGIASITDNYRDANEYGLKYWLGCYGEGVLGIALTDTFGSENFFAAFSKTIPAVTTAMEGPVATLPSAGNTTSRSDTGSLTQVHPPLDAPLRGQGKAQHSSKTYAQVFAGIRQDSGDPIRYVKMARQFYDSQGISDKKAIVFSDSLNVDRCIEYKKLAESDGFSPSFGIGTFLTNDFMRASDNAKSAPLNVVIKLVSADGRPCIKLSDDVGKNMGSSDLVRRVKNEVDYTDREWAEGDESRRWGEEGDK
ncbi:MAG: hypothetical protein Q9227_007238 [Pyrenula ochraceoflavens]